MPETDKKAKGWAGDVSTKVVKDRNFSKVSTNFVVRDATGKNGPKSVEGKLIAKDTQQFGANSVGRYKFEHDDAAQSTILGSVQLDDLMSNVEIGQYVRVTLDGTTKTSSKRDLKTYSLEIAE